MTVLIKVPIDDVGDGPPAEQAEPGDAVLVEVDRSDLPSGLTLAAAVKPGEAAGTMAESLPRVLDRLDPMLTALRDRFTAAEPDHVSVAFGLKLGGETGIIVAKGTAEVNFTVTLTWDRTR